MRHSATMATEFRRELREEQRHERQDYQDRMSSPVELTDDDLVNRAVKAHLRYCVCHGYRPDQPEGIKVDGRRITLRNANGALGVYRFVRRRIQRVSYERCEGLRRIKIN